MVRGSRTRQDKKKKLWQKKCKKVRVKGTATFRHRPWCFCFLVQIAIGVESWAGALEAALAVLRQRMRRRRLGLCRATKVGLGAGVSLFWCVTAADAASGSILAAGPLGEATERGGHGGGDPRAPQWAEWAYSRWSARLIPAPVLPKIGGPPRLWLEHAEHAGHYAYMDLGMESVTEQRCSQPAPRASLLGLGLLRMLRRGSPSHPPRGVFCAICLVSASLGVAGNGLVRFLVCR